MIAEKNHGFTLVEVLIVVAVVALLAAIAIPNVLRARLAANEASAQATLKQITNALENYYSINTQYPATTDVLRAAAPPYLGKDYFVGVHNGYGFVMTTLNSYDYLITATPTTTGNGRYTFTISTGGNINQF